MIILKKELRYSQDSDSVEKKKDNKKLLASAIIPVTAGLAINTAGAGLVYNASKKDKEFEKKISSELANKFKKQGGILISNKEGLDGATSTELFLSPYKKAGIKSKEDLKKLSSILNKYKSNGSEKDLKESIEKLVNYDKSKTKKLCNETKKLKKGGAIEIVSSAAKGKAVPIVTIDKGKETSSILAHELGHVYYHNEGKNSLVGLAHKLYKPENALKSRLGVLTGLSTGIKAGRSDEEESKLNKYSGALVSLATDAPMLGAEYGANIRGNKILNDAVKKYGSKAAGRVTKVPFLGSAAGYTGIAGLNAGISQGAHILGKKIGKKIKEKEEGK